MTNKPKKRHNRQTLQEKLAKAKEKGKREAMDEAVEAMMYIVLYTLKDKMGVTDDFLTRFADSFRYNIDTMNKGYITWRDIEETMKEEYGIVWETK